MQVCIVQTPKFFVDLYVTRTRTIINDNNSKFVQQHVYVLQIKKKWKVLLLSLPPELRNRIELSK